VATEDSTESRLPTESGAAAPRAADPPREFDTYEFVLLRLSSSAPVLDAAAAALLQRQHLGHLEMMKEAGHLKVSGPLTNQPDESLRGICIYQVGSLEEARRLAELDPAVRGGKLVVEVMNWLTAKGAKLQRDVEPAS
jgi:uncharacterized protein